MEQQLFIVIFVWGVIIFGFAPAMLKVINGISSKTEKVKLTMFLWIVLLCGAFSFYMLISKKIILYLLYTE